MSIEVSKCQHGLISGACRFCTRGASTNTLRDAWEIYNSKVGSYDSWSDASHVFYASGYPMQADYCSLRAIDALVQIHGRETKNFRQAFSQFVRDRLGTVTLIDKGRVHEGQLRRLLKDIKFSVLRTRDHRRAKGNNFLSLKAAHDALEQTGNNLTGSSGWEKRKLASNFRKFSKFKNYYTWDKPEVSVAIMDERIASFPNDGAAWNIKASAHGDLEDWTAASAAVHAGLRINPTDRYLLVTQGRILNGMGNGFDAWDPLITVLKKSFTVPVAAMLMTSCGIARLQTNLTQEQLKIISERRRFISGLIESLPEGAESYGDVDLETLGLQMLITDGKFVEAVVFVRELDEEGWLDRADYWNWEIDSAIKRAGLAPTTIRFEASKFKGDYFPDNPSI